MTCDNCCKEKPFEERFKTGVLIKSPSGMIWRVIAINRQKNAVCWLIDPDALDGAGHVAGTFSYQTIKDKFEIVCGGDDVT